MTRILMAAAAGALLLSSATVYAATPAGNTAISHGSSSHQTINFVQRCSNLASQWKIALDGHGTSANLGKAKADATKGEQLCKSTVATQQKRGAADYEAALKLLGVAPT